ncbi:MAG: GNAT family N-acetyltransferase, partial [Emcibacteraceae bacterium]|nr:GNAT family N-acetyltransferase [Emcibacteraceae bacterium]
KNFFFTRSHNQNIEYVKIMQDLYTRNMGHLLAVLKSDDTPIGRAGFSLFYGINDGDVDWFHWGSPDKFDGEEEIFELLELGYSLAKPFWGQGFASEIALAIRDYGYENLGIEGFSSLIIKENIGSTKVAEKMKPAEVIACMIDNNISYNYRNVKNG